MVHHAAKLLKLTEGCLGAKIIKIFFITSRVGMYLHFHLFNIYEKAELFGGF